MHIVGVWRSVFIIYLSNAAFDNATFLCTVWSCFFYLLFELKISSFSAIYCWIHLLWFSCFSESWVSTHQRKKTEQNVPKIVVFQCLITTRALNFPLFTLNGENNSNWIYKLVGINSSYVILNRFYSKWFIFCLLVLTSCKQQKSVSLYGMVWRSHFCYFL